MSWRVRPLRPFSGRFSVNADVERIDIPWPRATVLGVSWIIVVLRDFRDFRVSLRRGFPGGAALLRCCAFAHPASAAEKTPVVLISIDTLRADHLSAYGYTENPHAEHRFLRRQRNDLPAHRLADPLDAALAHVAHDFDLPI